MPITQKQLATELGLSRQTVGYALNGGGRISAEERSRVQEAARRLGYGAHSNPEARALIGKRYGRRAATGIIGCMHLPSDSVVAYPEEGDLSYEASLVRGIRNVAETAGSEVMLLGSRNSGGWEKVDGILTHGGGSIETLRNCGLDIPMVSLMNNVPGVCSVVADDCDGARQAVDHLVSLGHTRIAFLVDVSPGNYSPRERVRGYRAGLRAAGIDPRESWIGELVNWGAMHYRGLLSMRSWLADNWASLGCTALLIQNDRAAMGAMEALGEAGIQVPHDVSVVGFDGTGECEIVRPRLSSVYVPLQEIGAQATRLLLAQIRDAAAGRALAHPAATVLLTQFVARASTAIPRG